jgi:hypothetical protein
MQMNNNDHTPDRHRIVDYVAAAIDQMKQYSAANPGSPSAMRRPKLFVRGDLWIALLGPNLEEGIVGIGPTIATALRAFDAQYLAGLRPPMVMPGKSACRSGLRKFSGQRGVKTRTLNLIQIIVPARQVSRGRTIFRIAKAIRGFNSGRGIRARSGGSHNRSEIVMRITEQKDT